MNKKRYNLTISTYADAPTMENANASCICDSRPGLAIFPYIFLYFITSSGNRTYNMTRIQSHACDPAPH